MSDTITDNARETECRACIHGPEQCARAAFTEDGWLCAEKISRRKPHSHLAGYIAERRNPITDDYNIIFDAAEQGIDDTDGRYAVVCNAHGAILNTTNLPTARSAMKSSCFCEECMAETA